MNIRPATPDDAAALADVHIASQRAVYRGIMPDSHLAGFDPDRRARRFREAITAQPGETYVAEENGVVVGLLTLGGCRDGDVDHETTGEIRGIYLGPEHWRTGIGRKLLDEGERILRGRGFVTLALWVFEANERARRFYEASGYAVDGAMRILNAGAPLRAIRYRKDAGSGAGGA